MGEKQRHCHVYSKKVNGRIKLPSQPNKLYICIDNCTPTNNGPSFLGQVLGWWATMHTIRLFIATIYSIQKTLFMVHNSFCSGGSNEWCCCCSKAIVGQFIKKFCKSVRVSKKTSYQVVWLKVSAAFLWKNSIWFQFSYGFWMLGVYAWPYSKGYDT
jgi:hypothetical protein